MFRIFSLIGLLLVCAGCSKAPYDYAALRQADLRTQDLAVRVDHYRAEINRTVDGFIAAFADYEGARLVPAVRELYAEDAFVNDRIHSIEGRQSIVDYFASTLDKMHNAEFEVHERLYGDNSVCLSWTMRLQLNEGEEGWQFLGMSQLRFNQRGEIIYHQDFWDFSELMGQISGVAWIVNAIKARA